MLALGEFDFDDFGERGLLSKILLWLIFFFSTFMIQITFMNMLIAIMSQTFDNVSANSETSSIKERISLINDFSNFIDLCFGSSLNLDGQYLFIVQPRS